MVFRAAEVKDLFLFGRGLRSVRVATRVFLRTAWSFASRSKLLNMGQALVAPLRLSLHELDVPVWLNTGVEQLIVRDGRVVGVAAQKEGRPIRILARSGVLLAAGGFALPGGDAAIEIDHSQIDGPDDTRRLPIQSLAEAGDVVRISSGDPAS